MRKAPHFAGLVCVVVLLYCDVEAVEFGFYGVLYGLCDGVGVCAHAFGECFDCCGECGYLCDELAGFVVDAGYSVAEFGSSLDWLFDDEVA